MLNFYSSRNKINNLNFSNSISLKDENNLAILKGDLQLF